MKDIFFLVFNTNNEIISEKLQTLNEAIKFARIICWHLVKKYQHNGEETIDLGVVWTKKPESYWKSTLTGQVYAFEEGFVPQYDGWEPVHEETFIEYCTKMNIWR